MKYIGIDVAGKKKDQVVAVLDEQAELENVIFEKVKTERDVKNLADKILKECGKDAIIAIDAPRCLSHGPKDGRKCEREINSAKIAKPLWTPRKESFKPDVKPAQEWFEIGFWFYGAFGNNPNVIEVFPSASYHCLKDSGISFAVPCKYLTKKNSSDVVDAICAALTGYFYRKEKYSSYGDDREGEIIVPAV